jgi:hypothetical protein
MGGQIPKAKEVIIASQSTPWSGHHQQKTKPGQKFFPAPSLPKN